MGQMHVTVNQCEEALSDVNMFYAAKALGHQPNVREAITWYLAHTQLGTVVHFNVTASEAVESDDSDATTLFIGGTP